MDVLKHQPDKVDDVARLVYTEFQTFYDEEPDLPKNWESVAQNYRDEYMNDNKLPIVVLLTDDTSGKILASVTLEEEDGSAPKQLHPWITDAVELESERGNGVGKALMEGLMSLAAKLAKQSREQCLYVYTENGAEHREIDNPSFYKSLGFQELKQMELAGEEVTVLVGSVGGSDASSKACLAAAKIALGEASSKETGGGTDVSITINIGMNTSNKSIAVHPGRRAALS